MDQKKRFEVGFGEILRKGFETIKCANLELSNIQIFQYLPFQLLMELSTSFQMQVDHMLFIV